MADNRTAFIKRVISALLGAAVVFSLSYFGGTLGMEIVVTLSSILAVREFSRMVFQHWPMPQTVSWFYGFICIGLFIGGFMHFEAIILCFLFANILFLTGSLWLARSQATNENLLSALAIGSFGLMYCVVFPLFAVRLVNLDQGGQWFFFLLIVVFFGDTFAYFGGRWFGRAKLMPEVSPNKTWEGALSGLFGSSLAGVIHLSSIFQEVPWIQTLAFCIVCGVIAQSGDLLMSLVKRVAHVKDSGHLMPGHGGILDRLDGVFIACPLVYAFALYVRPF